MPSAHHIASCGSAHLPGCAIHPKSISLAGHGMQLWASVTDRLKPKALHKSLAGSFPCTQTLDLTQCKEPAQGMLSTLTGLKGLTALSLQLNDRGTSAALLDELQQLCGLTQLGLSGWDSFLVTVHQHIMTPCLDCNTAQFFLSRHCRNRPGSLCLAIRSCKPKGITGMPESCALLFTPPGKVFAKPGI